MAELEQKPSVSKTHAHGSIHSRSQGRPVSMAGQVCVAHRNDSLVYVALVIRETFESWG